MHCSGVLVEFTPIYLQDFEASDGGYTHSGTNDTWQYGAPTNGPGAAHSGAYVWATGLTGNYLDNEDAYLDSPDIDLSAYAGSGVRLGWWDWQYTETCCDYTAVQVSNDGGVNWNWVYGAQYVGVQDWTHHEVNLDASYAVSNFRVRFYFHSDLSVTYPGWFIDDVEISGACNAPEDGGLVVGNVYDTNLGMPLTGALVTNDSGGSTNTVAHARPECGRLVLYPVLPVWDARFHGLLSGLPDRHRACGCSQRRYGAPRFLSPIPGTSW